MPKREKKGAKTCKNCKHLQRDEKFADEIRWKCNNYKDKDGREAMFDRLGDKEASENCDDCVNWTKKGHATKATSPAPSVSSAAGTQDAEERKRQELLEAYKKRDEIQHDLFRAKSETTQLRASLASMSKESTGPMNRGALKLFQIF